MGPFPKYNLNLGPLSLEYAHCENVPSALMPHIQQTSFFHDIHFLVSYQFDHHVEGVDLWSIHPSFRLLILRVTLYDKHDNED